MFARTALAVTAVGALVVGWWPVTEAVGRESMAGQPVITSPQSGTVMASGPDYASDVFHDPWDFEGVEDLAQLPTSFAGWTISDTLALSQGRSAFLSGGFFVARSASVGALFPLLYQGGIHRVNVPQDRPGHLDRYAVPTAQFGKLSVKMTVSGHGQIPGTAGLYWTNRAFGASDEDEVSLTFGSIPDGVARIHTVDLVAQKWIRDDGSEQTSAPGKPWTTEARVRGLSFRPTFSDNADVSIDWMRLTAPDASAPATPVSFINCDQGDVYVIEAVEGTGPTPRAWGVIARGTVQTVGGPTTAQVNMGVLAPGAWDLRVRCHSLASNPVGVVINQPPLVSIANPDSMGSKDYATTELGNPWDMDALTDFASGSNVTGAQIIEDPPGSGIRALRAIATTGDPILDFLNFSPRLLNSREYQHLTFTLTLEYPYGLDGNLGDGSVLRILWGSPGMGGANLTATTDMIVWPGRNTYTIDLGALSVAGGSIVGLGPQIPWKNRIISGLRLDPHEADVAIRTALGRQPFMVPFRLGPVTLATTDTAQLGQTFPIEYSFKDPDTAGSTYFARVFLADDALGTNSRLLATITSGVTPNTSAPLIYQFDPLALGVAPGEYYVRVEINETRSGFTETQSIFSSGALRVVPSAGSVSNPQLTVLNPTADSVQAQFATMSGCAYDPGAPSGSIGVDEVAVYAVAGAGVTGTQAGQTLLLGYGQGLGTLLFGPLTTTTVPCPGAGPQFANSGFSVTNPSLTVGNWTLRTHARSSVSGRVTTVDTPFSVTNLPLAARNFSVTASGNQVTVSFAAPVGGPAPGRYQLEVGTDPTLARPSFTVELPSPGTYSGTLGNGVLYFRLKSLRADGFPGLSTSIIGLVLPGGGPPPAPPGPPVLNAPVVSGNNVTLTWGPGSGGAPSSYTIVAGTSPGGSNVGTFPMGSATSISAVVGNGVYFVRIIGTNVSGTATSNEVSFTVGPTSLPGVPTLNTASVNGGNVTLSWTTPSGSPTSYTIRARYTTGGPIIASLPATGNAVTVLAPPGTYLVTILATNALGSSAESNQITVVVP